jgi:hypothetical protein
MTHMARGTNHTTVSMMGRKSESRRDGHPNRLSNPQVALPTPEADAIMLAVPEPPVSGSPEPLTYAQRFAVVRSIIEHRTPSQEACTLAIRALCGVDVVAEAAG